MAGGRWIEDPVSVFLLEVGADLFVIHLFYGLEQLASCANEVCSIITPHFSDRTTAGDEALECLNKGT